MAKVGNLSSFINFVYGVKDIKNIENIDEVEFLGLCLTNVQKTESQNFQDIFALYENNFKTLGFYVEFGATNGKTVSNTYFLEKQYMWSGILAEPNPVWHEELERNRKSKNIIVKECVYNKSDETVDFLCTSAADLATISGFGMDDEHASKRQQGNLVRVKTITLFDMLKKYDAPKNIDYLSVDTEGSEYQILKAFFDNPESRDYNIKCVTIEHNSVAKTRDMLYNLMTSNGYKRKFEIFSRWDDFYVKEIE